MKINKKNYKRKRKRTGHDKITRERKETFCHVPSTTQHMIAVIRPQNYKRKLPNYKRKATKLCWQLNRINSYRRYLQSTGQLVVRCMCKYIYSDSRDKAWSKGLLSGGRSKTRGRRKVVSFVIYYSVLFLILS